MDFLRVAARSLRKQPVFTTVVVLSLALGIALNTTMYGILDALISPRIDMRDPGALYRISFYGDMHQRIDNAHREQVLAARMHTYESITRTEFGLSRLIPRLFEHGAQAHEGHVLGVASNYFDVLGVRPIAGRTFIAADENAELTPVVINEIIADKLFPNGEQATGAHINIASKPYVVVGVISAAAHPPGESVVAWEIAPRSEHGQFIRIIRLRPGVSRQDAARELKLIATQIGAEAGDQPKDVDFRMAQLADPAFQLKQLHYALFGAVFSVLLVACGNLTNIQLARGIVRRRELALRSALGATRRRLVVHLLNESFLLAAAGLLLGLLLTYWGSMALKASIPPSIGSYVVEPQFSWRVLAFALGAAVFCVVVAGLIPSIGISRTDPNDLLKSGAGTGATKKNRTRYAVLVSIEIGLAIALSCFAAVALRTTTMMSGFGAGYDTRPLSKGWISPVKLRGQAFRYSDLLQSIATRVRSVPGVIDVAATTGVGVEGYALSVDDASGVREIPAPGYGFQAVSPSYIRTMGLRIVKGRDFLDGEADHGSVLVDEASARFLWPNANPVGSLIKFGDKKSSRPYVRVVGVYGEDLRFDTQGKFRDMTVTHHALGNIIYAPASTDSLVASGNMISVQFIARAGEHPAELPIAIKRVSMSWKDMYLFSIETMDQVLGLTRQRDSVRFVAALFTMFATMGVGLAAFGVYGVVAYSVAERKREFGVRVALGAGVQDILRAVLRESIVVALAGTAIGLLMLTMEMALFGAWAVGSSIYDAAMFAGVAAIVVGVAAASAFVPALRATKIDPTESLRAE